MDDQYHTPYYYNVVTEESVWEMPEGYTPETDAYYDASSGAAAGDGSTGDGSGAASGEQFWEEQESHSVKWGKGGASEGAAPAAAATPSGDGSNDGNPYNGASGGGMKTPSPRPHGKGGKAVFTPMSASSRGSRLDPMTPFSTNSVMSDDDTTYVLARMRVAC